MKVKLPSPGNSFTETVLIEEIQSAELVNMNCDPIVNQYTDPQKVASVDFRPSLPISLIEEIFFELEQQGADRVSIHYDPNTNEYKFVGTKIESDTKPQEEALQRIHKLQEQADGYRCQISEYQSYSQLYLGYLEETNAELEKELLKLQEIQK